MATGGSVQCQGKRSFGYASHQQDGGLSLMAPPKGRLLAVRRSPTATVVSGNPYQFVVKRCVQVGGLAKH
jgi:hypothetical protein